jgi:hypothetical protein
MRSPPPGDIRVRQLGFERIDLMHHAVTGGAFARNVGRLNGFKAGFADIRSSKIHIYQVPLPRRRARSRKMEQCHKGRGTFL